jgi:hypothetical protein
MCQIAVRTEGPTAVTALLSGFGQEHGHVDAELGDQHLGGRLANPGDAHQRLPLGRERFDLLLDLG